MREWLYKHTAVTPSMTIKPSSPNLCSISSGLTQRPPASLFFCTHFQFRTSQVFSQTNHIRWPASPCHKTSVRAYLKPSFFTTRLSHFTICCLSFCQVRDGGWLLLHSKFWISSLYLFSFDLSLLISTSVTVWELWGRGRIGGQD